MYTNTDEKIIEMVRSHIELYDLSHSKCMDSAYKDRIWNFIGNEINLTGKWFCIYSITLHNLIYFLECNTIFLLNNFKEFSSLLRFWEFCFKKGVTI